MQGVNLRLAPARLMKLLSLVQVLICPVKGLSYSSSSHLTQPACSPSAAGHRSDLGGRVEEDWRHAWPSHSRRVPGGTRSSASTGRRAFDARDGTVGESVPVRREDVLGVDGGIDRTAASARLADVVLRLQRGSREHRSGWSLRGVALLVVLAGVAGGEESCRYDLALVVVVSLEAGKRNLVASKLLGEDL